MEEVCEIYIKRAILDKFALINQNIYAIETDLNAFWFASYKNSLKYIQKRQKNVTKYD